MSGSTAKEGPEVQVGDWVTIPNLQLQGQVVSPADAEGRLTVQAGGLRVTVAAQELEPTGGRQSPVRSRSAQRSPEARPTREAGMQLDLRGRRAEEVAGVLDAFVNDAFLANLTSVRVIHGYGTGVLREVVRELLERHPLVASFRAAEPNQGGAGVTVVELQT
jgi:DNA mismatch repair protein MutS2